MTTLSTIRGDDYRLTVTWSFDGDPIDLSNYSAAVLHVTIPGVDVDFTYQLGSGIEIPDPLLGVFEIHIEDTDTAQWIKSGDYYFYVQDTFGSNDVKTLLLGRFEVIPRDRS